MGNWTKAIYKQLGKPAKDFSPPPRGKAICEATKQHHFGILEKWGFGKDGAAGWIPYRGCVRCGLQQ